MTVDLEAEPTPATGPSLQTELEAIVRGWRGGRASAEIAVMELLIATESVALAAAAVADAPGLAALLEAHRPGCERICMMLQRGPDDDAPAASVEAGLAHARHLFDWSVAQHEETSVALYSLGSAEILDRATDEVVDLLERWGVLTPTTRALEIGCGIGRLLVPLAARVAHVTGIDLAPRMVETARRRLAGQPRIAVQGSSGRDLAGFADGSLDLVLAVDSFPYVVQAGAALVDALVTEVGRVLAPGGRFVVLGYSYRGDDDRDRREVEAVARTSGLAVERCGERPFRLWSALAFLLVRRRVDPRAA